MRTYTEQEYQALEQRLAKIELMYDKLANIHSKQEEKYNKLKENFLDLLQVRLDIYGGKFKDPDGIDEYDVNTLRNDWLNDAGLKEQ